MGNQHCIYLKRRIGSPASFVPNQLQKYIIRDDNVSFGKAITRKDWTLVTFGSAHFQNGLVIKSGSRRTRRLDPEWTAGPEFYHIRSNGSSLCRRCIQIKPDPGLLNSCFCYILKVPFDPKDKSGIVYVWIGSKADPEEARVAEELVNNTKMFSNVETTSGMGSEYILSSLSFVNLRCPGTKFR